MTGRVRSIETSTIYQIPLDQRHGRSWNLFTVWFGASLSILTIASGALGPTIFKLDFVDALLSIVIGNLVGAVFMALHAAQGPHLGVPQMVQTRGQFGSFGAIAVITVVIIMYVGFFASNLVVGSQALHSIATGVSAISWLLALCALGLLGAVFGHDLIHLFNKALSLLAGLSLIVCGVWIVYVHGLPPSFFTKGAFTTAGFLANISFGVLWQIAYAPYVSDYSRYLPPGTGSRTAFWASYAGTVLGTIFPMGLGAALANLVPNGDPVTSLTTVMGAMAWIVVPIFVGGIATGNAMNLYCGSLSAITIMQTIWPRLQAGSGTRAATAVVLAAASVLIALLATANFMEAWANFLSLLLYVLVPWTAINLVDYYLVQHGRYDVSAFFRRDGGIYGKYNMPALICYAVGIVIQIPFMATGIYTGPIAVMMNGVDTSWIVGLAVVGLLYWAIARKNAVALRLAAASADGTDPRLAAR